MEDGTLKPSNNFAILYLFLYEAIGTFLLANAVSLASGFDPGICIAGVLFIAINLCGGISGAHFNGAVTIGVYIIEGKWIENLRILVVYFLA